MAPNETNDTFENLAWFKRDDYVMILPAKNNSWTADENSKSRNQWPKKILI